MIAVLFTLLTAGIMAGLIQYFVDFRGLPVYQPPKKDADPHSFEKELKLSWIIILYNWMKRHWQFVGYLTIGIAGALLTPLILKLTDPSVSEKIEIISPCCCVLCFWNYLILLGYGIVFGYSSVWIIRSIGILLTGNLLRNQAEIQNQIDKLKQKIEEPTPKSPQPDGNAHLSSLTSSISLEHLRESPDDYYNKVKDDNDKHRYYFSINMSDNDSLYSSLSQLLSSSHKIQPTYQPSIHLYPKADRHQGGLLKSIYSGKSFDLETILFLDALQDKKRAAATAEISLHNLSAEQIQTKLDKIEKELPYNCEHVIPQSWFSKKEPMRGDLHHLFTCESDCNSFRGNNPYYDFPEIENVIRKDCGILQDNKFEPEINKGVVARAVLYFLTRYPQVIDHAMGYTAAHIPMLLKWNADEKVTLYESHRNQTIFKMQGNRNPFIDFPELANKINFDQAFKN